MDGGFAAVDGGSSPWYSAAVYEMAGKYADSDFPGPTQGLASVERKYDTIRSVSLCSVLAVQCRAPERAGLILEDARAPIFKVTVSFWALSLGCPSYLHSLSHRQFSTQSGASLIHREVHGKAPVWVSATIDG